MTNPNIQILGSIIVSFVVLLTFVVALGVSFFMKDSTIMALTVGAAIANATTAVGFWLGSSSGSQKKDDVIGAALATGGGATGAGTGAGGAGTGATGAGGG